MYRQVQYVHTSVCLLVVPFNYATELQNLRFDATVCMLMRLPPQEAGENREPFVFFDKLSSLVCRRSVQWIHEVTVPSQE